MKKAVFILSVVIVIISTTASSLLAQNIRTIKVATTYMLTGSIISNKVEQAISMTLTIDDENNANGRYYYHDTDEYIELKGKATINGAIVLSEITTNEDKAEFIGTFNWEKITLVGTFVISNTETEMPFRLSTSSASQVSYIETIRTYYSERFQYKYEYIKLHSKSTIRGIDIFNKRLEYAAGRNELFLRSQIEEARKDHTRASAKHIFDTTTSFIYADENIISIATKSHEYIGGDNSYGGLAYYIYDINTGRLLSESVERLVLNRNDETLIVLLKQKLLKNYRKSDFINFNNITLNNNFYIDDIGVHFVYNENEIASATVGEVFVSFTFKELVPFVNSNSIFSYLFD